MVPKIVILPGSVRMCPRVPILVFLWLSPARLSCKWQIECWCDSVPVPGAASNTLSLWCSIRPPGMTSYLTAWVCGSVCFPVLSILSGSLPLNLLVPVPVYWESKCVLPLLSCPCLHLCENHALKCFTLIESFMPLQWKYSISRFPLSC